MRDEQLRELMRAAQRGDPAGYTQLLEAIAPRIRRIVARRRHFAGIQEVEDLVQDVLLSVHAVRATYDPSRAFGPWLMAIIRHRLADGARRHTRHARELPIDNLDVTFADRAANPSVGDSDEVEALGRAIRALPPGQRQAIQLLKLEEKSLKEAASVTGLSVGALKVATHRAMASLRNLLRQG
jgi:RNA polymerase sigma-70 factor (ECF subfamily)